MTFEDLKKFVEIKLNGAKTATDYTVWCLYYDRADGAVEFAMNSKEINPAALTAWWMKKSKEFKMFSPVEG